MSDSEWTEIPRTDYRVAPKFKPAPKKRAIKKVVDKVAEYAFVKANLAMHGVLNRDGSFKKF